MNQHARIAESPIPLIDLGAQRRKLGAVVDRAVARVLAHGQFVMGPEVGELEQALAEYCGARYAISCASGTDALRLVLMAKEVGPGDAVICPSFTFAATAEVVALSRAMPVFADVHEQTFNLDPDSLERAISTARKLGLAPKAIIPVDLFGLPADHDSIAEIAKHHGLFVLDDAAQAFGASYKGKVLGTFGLATATSFFPAKPLGCYGDGGAVFTDDAELANAMRSLRVHGEGKDKYDNVRIGLTSRLDTIQAAILIEKLKVFPEEIEARNRIAKRYNEALRELALVPQIPSYCSSVWAQYTIRLAPGCRDTVADKLKTEGIASAVYYRRPLHRQFAYREYPVAEGGLPVSERLADEVISLPMHAYLEAATQDRIVQAVRSALER